MPNPTQADLHVNAPLTNVSIAYMQSADTYIADKVFPLVPVQKQSDIFWKFSKSDWRRTEVRKRAPGTEAPGVGWNMQTDTYYAEQYAVKHDITDEERANADSNFNLERDATEFITNQMLLSRDIDWTTRYFGASIWSTTKTGVASGPTGTQYVQWDQAASDPINDVATAFIAFRLLTGFAPNICVMGPYVMNALKQHPDIIDRIKYTQRGVVTEDLIATLFDVDELYVNYASVASGQQINDAKAQDAAATYSFIADSKAVGFFYSPSAPALRTPAAGYIFQWVALVGSGGRGIRIRRFRMEHISTDRIQAEQTYDMKVVGADMGLYFTAAVA